MGKRAITFEIARNKGLTPRRKKEQRNPRVKNRNKYRKAKIRRKGQVSVYSWCTQLDLCGFAGHLSHMMMVVHLNKLLFIHILPYFRFVNHALKYPDMQEKFLVSKQVSRKVLGSLSFVFIKDESDWFCFSSQLLRLKVRSVYNLKYYFTYEELI